MNHDCPIIETNFDVYACRQISNANLFDTKVEETQRSLGNCQKHRIRSCSRV